MAVCDDALDNSWSVLRAHPWRRRAAAFLIASSDRHADAAQGSNLDNVIPNDAVESATWAGIGTGEYPSSIIIHAATPWASMKSANMQEMVGYIV